MNPTFDPLLKRLEQLSDQFRELKEGVQKAVLVADLDPEMALTRARKVLEHLIRDVYERRLGEPPGTRPLENLIQRLVKDGIFPDRLDAYASTVRKLGNVGTHTFGERVTAADVYQSLTQLMPILEWYFEETQANRGKPKRSDSRIPTPDPRPSESRIAIVPKGLRSFDSADSGFFLELLPGVRDEQGIPESIRFWKTRIEATDADATFAVGLMYGPSGCGKSSLVKAGLLPRLAKSVVAIYVEATAADTEARLLKSLRRLVSDLPDDLNLVATVAAPRQGKHLPANKKVLIVLDQFEQWLHAKAGEDDTELVQALRQCDGSRVQCIVMVRDDFGMAATRFMAALEIPIVQGQNFATVDLFDLLHARKVLAQFGRAYGRLPDNLQCNKDEDAFLDQAVAGLAQDGKVISVRLALFAEMMRGKPWTPATLKAVGGTEGVGVTFLEETFSAATAPPNYRLHQVAIREVLKALLPESGSDIKGNMRSHGELLAASGYANRPKDFDEVIRILDSELRLITPTDAEDAGERGYVSAPSASREDSLGALTQPRSPRYYQLTHDYLVHSLREWLTRKQKESKRGRAELLLEERAALWQVKPINRLLPSLREYFTIRKHTKRRNWTAPQKVMMKRTGRRHLRRWFVISFLLCAFTLTSIYSFGAAQARILIRRLEDVSVSKVPEVVKELRNYYFWADELLKGRIEENVKRFADDEREFLQKPDYIRSVLDKTLQKAAGMDQLAALSYLREQCEIHKLWRFRLALLATDRAQMEPLAQIMLNSGPDQLVIVAVALVRHGYRLDPAISKSLVAAEVPREKRLRAAAASTYFDRPDSWWQSISDLVVADLVRESPEQFSRWKYVFLPKAELLMPALLRQYRSKESSERFLATSLLAEYAHNKPRILADLLMQADDKQFGVIYAKPNDRWEVQEICDALSAEIDRTMPVDSKDDDKEILAHRQANAAVALLRMNQPEKIWPLLKHNPDPRVRSYLIHRLAPMGADAAAIVKRLDEEPDIAVRRALILCLGEFNDEQFPQKDRADFIPKLQNLYSNDPDPGMHSAAEWLLRQWKQDAWLTQVNEEFAKASRERQRPENASAPVADAPGSPNAKKWFVNGQGQTFAVIPGPVEFLMGSPLTEANRRDDEIQHKVRIGRTVAIAAKHVTIAEYRQFDATYSIDSRFAPTPDCPVYGMNWFQAAAYCNWLSKQEGLPESEWCYRESQGKVWLADDCLKRTGYRLPTEAEWEFATRAVDTSRFYGEADELLPKYAWYLANANDQSRPAGGKKPNDFGLFEAHGTLWCWCQSDCRAYPTDANHVATDEMANVSQVDELECRRIRGGSYNNPASRLRSAIRGGHSAVGKNSEFGIRLAKTLPPQSP